MNENVLLFGLYEEISLRANMTKESKDVYESFMLDLSEHGIEYDVRSSSTDSGTKNDV